MAHWVFSQFRGLFSEEEFLFPQGLAQSVHKQGYVFHTLSTGPAWCLRKAGLTCLSTCFRYVENPVSCGRRLGVVGKAARSRTCLWISCGNPGGPKLSVPYGTLWTSRHTRRGRSNPYPGIALPHRRQQLSAAVHNGGRLCQLRTWIRSRAAGPRTPAAGLPRTSLLSNPFSAA